MLAPVTIFVVVMICGEDNVRLGKASEGSIWNISKAVWGSLEKETWEERGLLKWHNFLQFGNVLARVVE